jgi:hypothetical protein
MRAFLSCCVMLLSGAALAQTQPAGSSPMPSLVTPSTPAPFSKGSFQLLLMAPPAVTETLLDARPTGFGIGQTTVQGSGVFGYIGLAGGVGYSVTDLIEVGGAVAFYINGANTAGVDLGTSGVYQLQGEPFIKLNLGSVFKSGTLNPYVLGGFGFGVQGTMGTEGQAWGLFGLDLDPGVEWLFGGRWGVDAFVPIQFQLATHQGNQIGINLGVGYGLVGYL